MNSEVFHNGERNEQMHDVEVQLVAPEGLGYGEGSISHKELAATLDEELKAKVESALESPKILVDVDKDENGNYLDDDGCGDGRGVRRIFQGVIEKAKSLTRAKMFGGGPSMAVATKIGLGRAINQKIQGVFSDGIGFLRQKGIDFGGHTDTQAWY